MHPLQHARKEVLFKEFFILGQKFIQLTYLLHLGNMMPVQSRVLELVPIKQAGSLSINYSKHQWILLSIQLH